MGDERRLIAFLADYLGSQVRGIGLHQQAILGDPPRRRGQIGGVLVGDVARERDRIAPLQALVQARGHREAVDHHA